MAARKFELPGIQDLSKEQEAARALPKEGQHLIVGGPGTGKSVLALLRSKRHHRNGDDYVFLVYNHLLHRASDQLFGGELNSDTWMAWFRRVFGDSTGRKVPLLPPQPNGFQKEDWAGIRKVTDTSSELSEILRPHLVIDEGQDMPQEFYEALISLGFENFFVVADQNQQISQDNSSRRQLQDSLALDLKDVIELKANYRNRYSVARLAQEFYTGDPASPPPSLPEGTSSRRTVPVLYSYHETDLEKVARIILQHADRDPSRLIGVMTPSNNVRERYVKALEDCDIQLDNPRHKIETSWTNNYPDVTFGKGGILVINAQSCKGLEFDTAILADVDTHYYSSSDPDATKRLFYVMVARAIDRVFLFERRNPHGRSRIDEILPKDQSILRREEL